MRRRRHDLQGKTVVDAEQRVYTSYQRRLGHGALAPEEHSDVTTYACGPVVGSNVYSQHTLASGGHACGYRLPGRRTEGLQSIGMSITAHFNGTSSATQCTSLACS